MIQKIKLITIHGSRKQPPIFWLFAIIVLVVLLIGDGIYYAYIGKIEKSQFDNIIRILFGVILFLQIFYNNQRVEIDLTNKKLNIASNIFYKKTINLSRTDEVNLSESSLVIKHNNSTPSHLEIPGTFFKDNSKLLQLKEIIELTVSDSLIGTAKPAWAIERTQWAITTNTGRYVIFAAIIGLIFFLLKK